jgi:hypothetical protein
MSASPGMASGEGRKAGAEQAERQAGGVLVGVQPDHQHAEQRRQQRAGAHAGGKAQPVAPGVDHGGKAGDGGAQHHALGAQVDDAGLLVDQQPERGQRQHGAGIERRGDEQCVGFHLGYQISKYRTQKTQKDAEDAKKSVEEKSSNWSRFPSAAFASSASGCPASCRTLQRRLK